MTSQLDQFYSAHVKQHDYVLAERPPSLMSVSTAGWNETFVQGFVVSQILNYTEPQTAPDVLVSTLHGSHRHQFMTVCINY